MRPGDCVDLGGGRRLWATTNTYVISDGGGWLPGIYATEDAARAAFDVDVARLQAISDRVCTVHGEDRAITGDDLRSAA